MKNKNKYKKVFYTDQKRKAKKSVPPPIKGKEGMASTDMEKAEVLRESFDSVFTGNQASYISHIHYGIRRAKLLTL